jgi:hypothetical protein
MSCWSVRLISRVAGLHGGFREEGGDSKRESAHQDEEEEAKECLCGCLGEEVAIVVPLPCPDSVLVFGMLQFIGYLQYI